MYSELKDLLAAGVVDNDFYFNNVLTREKVTKKNACICYSEYAHKSRIDDQIFLGFFPAGESLFYYHDRNDLKRIKCLDFGILARPSFRAFKHFLHVTTDIGKIHVFVNCPSPMQEKINALYKELQDDQRGDLIVLNIEYPNKDRYKRVLFFPHNWNF